MFCKRSVFPTGVFYYREIIDFNTGIISVVTATEISSLALQSSDDSMDNVQQYSVPTSSQTMPPSEVRDNGPPVEPPPKRARITSLTQAQSFPEPKVIAYNSDSGSNFIYHNLIFYKITNPNLSKKSKLG